MSSSHVLTHLEKASDVNNSLKHLFQPLPLYKDDLSAFIYKDKYLLWMNSCPKNYSQLFALVRTLSKTIVGPTQVKLEPAIIDQNKFSSASLHVVEQEKQAALVRLDLIIDARLETANKEYMQHNATLEKNQKIIQQLTSLRDKLPGSSPQHNRISLNVQNREQDNNTMVEAITRVWQDQRKSIRLEQRIETQKIERGSTDQKMNLLSAALKPAKLDVIRAQIITDLLVDAGLAGDKLSLKCQVPNVELWNLIDALQNINHHPIKSPFSLTKSLLTSLAARKDDTAKARLSYAKRTWMSANRGTIRCHELPLRRIEDIYAFWQQLNKKGSWSDKYWLEQPQDLVTLKKDIIHILLNHQVPEGPDYLHEMKSLMEIQEHVRQFLSTQLIPVTPSYLFLAAKEKPVGVEPAKFNHLHLKS